MSTADGQVIGLSQIWQPGAPARNWNLVLVAEGYRREELDRFRRDAESFRDHLFSIDPFSRAEIKNAINIFTAEVASRESGADHPVCRGVGPGTTARTYFDARFCFDRNIQRLLAGDSELVIDTVSALIDGWHQILVLVNDAERGGAGGTVPWSSNSSPDWRDVAIHELGHSAFGLADEYDAGGPARWPGGDPRQPNVSAAPSPYRAPWKAHSTPGLPTPARLNPNWDHPTQREDPGPNPHPPGTIGTFEGAHYSGAGLYRPSWDCKMRHTHAPFCFVCVEQIVAKMAPYLAD